MEVECLDNQECHLQWARCILNQIVIIFRLYLFECGNLKAKKVLRQLISG